MTWRCGPRCLSVRCSFGPPFPPRCCLPQALKFSMSFSSWRFRLINSRFTASLSGSVAVFCLISNCDDETDDLPLSGHSALASAQGCSEFFKTFSRAKEKDGKAVSRSVMSFSHDDNSQSRVLFLFCSISFRYSTDPPRTCVVPVLTKGEKASTLR